MKTILVTRPSPDGEMLCALLEAAGFHSVFFPTLTLEALNPAVIDLSSFDYTVFISPAAVRFFIKSHSNIWPKSNHVLVMGSATAQVCLEAGIPVTLLPLNAYNSEALLALPQLQKVQGKRFLVIKGEGGRDTIGRVLGNRGAIVEDWVVYRRFPSIPANFKVEWSTIDVIIVSSLEALSSLKQSQTMADLQGLLQTNLLVSSDRLQEGAKAMGFTGSFIMAPNATAHAILDTLSALLTH